MFWTAAIQRLAQALGAFGFLAHVKGKSGEIALFEVLWQKEDITSMLPTITLEPSWGIEGEVPVVRSGSRPDGLFRQFDRVTFLATVPANGIAIYELRMEGQPYEPSPNQGWNPETGVLETDRYRLRLDADGLQSLVD